VEHERLSELLCGPHRRPVEMSRRAAYTTLVVVGTIFLLGIGDILVDPIVIPEEILRIAIAILSGVAIGAIVSGLRADGN
jgi:hypothetical protein